MVGREREKFKSSNKGALYILRSVVLDGIGF
mgnify:CR=1 FL=1